MDKEKSGSNEPDWTKGIKNSTVCNFFYGFFWVYVALAVIALIGMITVMLAVKMPRGMMFSSIFSNLIVIALSATMALFHYLICARALSA